ncbi:hypothetical protein HJFPF1_02608 [Paramyrothecium foliicola]|nr:hypothetical protein HJFPF1_02608 [Paramyrothecium foliicola]
MRTAESRPVAPAKGPTLLSSIVHISLNRVLPFVPTDPLLKAESAKMAEDHESTIAPDETPAASAADVEMEGAGDDHDNAHDSLMPFAGGELVEARTTFVSYLMSPIVTLLVGRDDPVILSAHQTLLLKSPFFQDACKSFIEDGSRRPQPRQVELPDDDTDAVGCFLEYLYTGEYFPKKLPGQRVLEADPNVPAVDDTGDQLLKHARVYTLAEKYGVDALKTLASSKIHCVNSTAKGEIAYARYVYTYTVADDNTIRAPVASFWATRSHTLRAEAEDEFKALCLEHPQFGYDVLTRVLDDKLKRERNEKTHPASGSHRKRPRQSTGA